MIDDGQPRHPAIVHEGGVRSVGVRARRVIAALAVGAIFDGVGAVYCQLPQAEATRDPAETGIDALGMVIVGWLVLFVVTAWLFAGWLQQTIRTTRVLGASDLAFTSGDVVPGFLIPLLNWVRPYQIVRALHAALEPDRVPAPEPHANVDDTSGYRDLAIDVPPAPPSISSAQIGTWWTLWLGWMLVARFAGLWLSLALVVRAACAIVAIVMVRALTARVAERYRRIRYGDPEALRAAGVVFRASDPSAITGAV